MASAHKNASAKGCAAKAIQKSPPKPARKKGGGNPPKPTHVPAGVSTPPAPRKSGRVPNLDQPVDLSGVKMSGGAKALLGGACDRKLAAAFGF